MKLVLLMFIVILSGCGPDATIDPELRPMVSDLSEVLDRHGVILSLNISFLIDDENKYTGFKPSGSFIGAVCLVRNYPKNPLKKVREVYLSPRVIKNIGNTSYHYLDNKLMAILVHEVGHCQFGLSHRGSGYDINEKTGRVVDWTIDDDRFHLMNKKIGDIPPDEDSYEKLFGAYKNSIIRDFINLIPKNTVFKREVKFSCSID
jgi:hypothetical protein